MATWTLVDQGVVSLGGFAVGLLLARSLAPSEYGAYTLLVLLMLAMQVATTSLLFYPLSVRGTVLANRDRAELFGTGLLLLLALCVPLGALLAAMLTVLGRPGLIVPALAWFLLWQVQELLRRALFAEMRHAAAIPGDAVSYLGQGIAVLALSVAGQLTLTSALAAMAASSGLAALLQATQVSLGFDRSAEWRRVARSCWGLGAYSLGSGLVSALRFQVFPWTLVAIGGTVLAANLQAATNLVLFTNPLVLGLCNVIPQAAARGRAESGVVEAWRASRSFIALGAGPVLGCYALLLAWPDEALLVLYGSDSPYLSVASLVRAMTFTAAANYVADMVCSYLHGIEEARLAMKVNLLGLAIAVVIGLPLTLAAGLAGSSAGLIAASTARAVAACLVLTRVFSDERRRFA